MVESYDHYAMPCSREEKAFLVVDVANKVLAISSSAMNFSRPDLAAVLALSDFEVEVNLLSAGVYCSGLTTGCRS
ncbi:hypothetical protein GCM10010080_31240 [Thermomonas carbonis]|nr:hypothetical protein GCM10010080_31240 [Thermomonas carbonis]